MILGFDTSAPHCSAALLDKGKVLAQTHEEMARGQAEALFPRLNDLVKTVGADWQDLTALGVGIGPGNFTGIRLSVAAARGLALSLDIPAVGVSSLEATAYGATGARLVCHAARRGFVYVQGFDTKRHTAPQAISLDAIEPSWAEDGVRCMGPACTEVAQRIGAPTLQATTLPGTAIAYIAEERWRVTASAPKPLYLRAPDAAPARDAGPVILDDA